MKRFEACSERSLHEEVLDADLVVVGGGLAGVCAAITAARAGLEVVLLQDRPVLGGNASSEVRLWILGATSHMGNNNRWAREGGVVDEILVENTWRNPEGNAVVFDTILLEKVVAEERIRLLLNTSVYEVAKTGADSIESVRGFCSQHSTRYTARAPLFCDASGDGVVGFLAGAAFRMGAESKDEFDEGFAPSAEYGELLGHSLYFDTKDVGKPVQFVPPSYALQDIERIPRWRSFKTADFGCKLWWIEYGGRLDTVHATEEIKWELWRVVYGVWNHIKNSGSFPEAESLALEWVGHIPGKRESRRFEGDYILSQRDVIEQREHEDAVSCGGWAIDLHPADGVFSELPGCNQWHSRGVYQIPYRCMYSRNIDNLFLAGRIISASHVAFGSSRVMATCGHGAQAVALAAAQCRALSCLPRDLLEGERMRVLQRELLTRGQHIPHVELPDSRDLAESAELTSSSRLELSELRAGSDFAQLDVSRAMLLPFAEGPAPTMSLELEAREASELHVELRTSSRRGGFTQDLVLAERTIELAQGAQSVELDFGVDFERAQYATLCLLANPDLRLRLSDARVTGVLALTKRAHERVSDGSSTGQAPPEGIGVESFDFWIPERRPAGKNFAMRISPALDVFAASNVAHGPERPVESANAWAADPSDASPWIEFRWPVARKIGRVVLCCDTDFDHPMESVLMGHPERAMPFCARAFEIQSKGETLVAVSDNHQSRREFRLDVTTDCLRVAVQHPSPELPASFFRVRIYES